MYGKEKQKIWKKALRAFIKGNKVLLAALGGAAAGITLSNILGIEKAQQIVKAVEDSVSSIGDKITNGLHKSTQPKERSPKHALDEA